MGATKEIATFVVETPSDDIPEAAFNAAKRSILDGLGAAMAAVREPLSMIITDYVRYQGGTSECCVIGYGFNTSAPQAALVNGTLMHALDYDDVSTAMGGHPTAAIFPSVLALGQTINASGKDLLVAYILGVEVAIQIGLGLGSKHYARGWHATGTLGSLGAAAACCRLLGLDVNQTRMGLGLAASQATGLRQNFGTMTKSFHAGRAAYNGVVAASLAGRGFTADVDIMEAPLGFCQVLAEEYDLNVMISSIGKPFCIIDPGLDIKLYPCCRVAHRAIDSILHLLTRYDFSSEEVSEIVCVTSPQLPEILIYSQPKSGLEGKFSMEFCLAIAICDGEVGLDQFQDDKVLEPAVQELMKKVRYIHEGEVTRGLALPSSPITVRVKLQDGRYLSQRIDVPRGDPQNPLTLDELISKYRMCAQVSLSPHQLEQSLDLVLNLEKSADITELAELVNCAI